MTRRTAPRTPLLAAAESGFSHGVDALLRCGGTRQPPLPTAPQLNRALEIARVEGHETVCSLLRRRLGSAVAASAQPQPSPVMPRLEPAMPAAVDAAPAAPAAPAAQAAPAAEDAGRTEAGLAQFSDGLTDSVADAAARGPPPASALCERARPPSAPGSPLAPARPGSPSPGSPLPPLRSGAPTLATGSPIAARSLPPLGMASRSSLGNVSTLSPLVAQ